MQPSIDWDALLPNVARRLFGEPKMRSDDIWRYGSDESLEVHVGRGTWRDRKANVDGTTLDLVKRALSCDEANAMRWLRDQGLIRPPRA